MWIDTHCHLNHERFDGAEPSVLAQEARAQGVSGMVSVCCRISDEFENLLEIARQNAGVWCSLGTHPHEAGDAAEQGVTLEGLVKLANSDPKIVAIGETGLDYYYDSAPRDLQEASFRKHIRACIETGLPLIVHARDADEDIARILREEGAGVKPLKGVLHCFSSGAKLAETALEMGFYVSFSGIVTFKNAHDLQEIAKTIPLNRILVETDAPFLAPVPHRGKTNHPAFVRHTGEFLAALRGEDVADFAAQTTRNFFTLFDRAKL